jgi:hypothetical protein
LAPYADDIDFGNQSNAFNGGAAIGDLDGDGDIPPVNEAGPPNSLGVPAFLVKHVELAVIG